MSLPNLSNPFKEMENKTSLITPSKGLNPVQKRRGIRIQTTKSVQKLESLLETDIDINKINGVIKTLERCLEDLALLDETIQANLDETTFISDLEDSIERRENVETILHKAYSILKEEEKNSRKSSRSSDDETSSHKSDYKSKLNKKAELFRLPQKKLPCFSGEILEFNSFLESFLSIVEDRGFSNIDKLQCLLDCLKGPALTSVCGYARIGDNYPIILNQLKQDFGNSRKLIETLILKMTALPSPKYNYTSLFNFKANIHCYFESLKTQKIIDGQGCSIILGTILAQKLPSELISHLPLGEPRDNWTVDLVLEIISKNLYTLETIGQTLILPENQRKEKSPNFNNKFNEHKNFQKKEEKPRQVTTLNINSGTKPKTQTSVYNKTITQTQPQSQMPSQAKVPKCVYCREEHYSSNCNIFNLKSRQLFVRQNKHCSKCLNTFHTTSQCTSTKNCYLCKSPDHHTSLCDRETHSNQSSESHTNTVSTLQI
ncbi:UNVERIFIED_CONTAM: hypothetical protein RMT77_017866 [Armadillidium vulgare]